MKRFFTVPAILMASTLYAQQTSGTVTYQQVSTIDIKDTGLPEGVAGMLPREHKSVKVLYFSPDASLYEFKETAKAEEPTELQQDNINIRIEQHIPDEKIFTDLKNQLRVAQQELMGRTFLVTDTLAEHRWKFTGRQKMILDKPCMEAYCILQTDSITRDSVVAWYTTAIPVAAGPENFTGLPGLILEVFKGSNIHIIATALEAILPENKIKAPSKGKKIAPEAFAKLQQEKMEEMQKQYGGKGNMIIIKR